MRRNSLFNFRAIWRSITFKAIVAELAFLTVGFLPVRDLSRVGIAEILTVLFAIVTAGLSARTLCHIYARYLSRGIAGWTLAEILFVALCVATVIMLIGGDRHQLPQLAGIGFVGTCLFLVIASSMEGRRAELLAEGGGAVELPRATEVVRDSSLWGWLCVIVQRGGGFTAWMRGALSGEDRAVGRYSFGASVAMLTTSLVGAIALGTVLLSVIVPAAPAPEVDAPPVSHEDERSEWHSEPAAGRRRASGQDDQWDCDGDVDLGPAVDALARRALTLGWQGVDGVEPGEMEALGSDIAGCPGWAQPIPGLEGGWFARGHCGDELRAVVVALPGAERPVVTLEQAAEFVLPMIHSGQFLSAVDRFQVGEGDAYIVTSRHGSYVLIRGAVTAGAVEPPSEVEGCAGFVDEDVAYSVVGPDLLGAWRSSAAVSLNGVLPAAEARRHDGSGEFAMLSGGRIVAKARCGAKGLSCQVSYERGDWQEVVGEPSIDKHEVLALAE